MNILITSAGRRVSLLKSFQKELKKVVDDGKVYATDSNPLLSAACHVADGYIKVPKLDDPDYINVLLEFCKGHDISLIIPTIDTELIELARNKHLFEKHNISVLVSSFEFVSLCRDKRSMHEFLKKNDIKVAKEYSKNDYALPIFIKPTDGSRSIDTFIIKEEEDFKQFHFSNDKLMFLEYLDQEDYDEFTCDLYYDKNHQLKCVVPRKRIEVRDGEVYKALTCNNELVDYVRNKLNLIEGAVGCLTAQFFMHKLDFTRIYAIEINPRFGGGYPLTYLSGANFTKWTIEEYLLDTTIDDKFEVWEANLLMIRYDDEILVHGYKG